MHISFLGATDTVTGSKYLLESGGRRILVDCGLFQGFKQLRLRNWQPLPADPATIDAVVLTHAHIDHSGYLPLLVRDGFSGPIFATPATRDLCGILLPDSGRIHEEDARFANKHRFSRHRPALPLYTEADAEAALKRFVPVPFHVGTKLDGQTEATFVPAGHIPGAASVRIQGPSASVLFSGDLGRRHDPIMRAPEPPTSADFLVVESTYGDRLHPDADPEHDLGAVLSRTLERGGVVVIPAFAVGRAQAILYYLRRLRVARAIPDVPVFLDSPMAVRATSVLERHVAEHRLSADECMAVCSSATFVSTREESKALSRRRGPMIVVSASGMATGGRVVHHVKTFAPDPRNAIVFAGYQAAGTRGATMVGGAKEVKIHGEYVPINAEVVNLHYLSAHADSREIVEWLGALAAPPRTVFITHGEPVAQDGLRRRIEERFRWDCVVPYYLERRRLS